MDEDPPPCMCVIHFEGEGDMKALSDVTLKTIIERRKQWLELPGKYNKFSCVAEKSFEFIPAVVDTIDQLPRKCFYHIQCYRNFTDISKIERAKKTLANTIQKNGFVQYSAKILFNLQGIWANLYY
jgi:hypothetical protein